jgi:probable phosphoglycerate mutase
MLKYVVVLMLALNTTVNAFQTEILLIRHGETDWNIENKIQGSTDNPLNDTGFAQAEQLSEKIFKYYPDIAKTVYSSDLIRAIQTAKKTVAYFKSKELPLFGIVTDPNLQEFDWGSIEGMLVPEKYALSKDYLDDLKAKYPLRKDRWSYPLAPAKGVESLNQLVERTKKALTKIALEHPGEKVAVFAHGRVINTLIIEAQDLNIDERPGLPNCAVVHFRYNSEKENPIEFVEIENLLEKP